MHYINRCLEPGRILNYKESIINKSLIINNGEIFKDVKQAGMLELQLTDKCNLNCFHCHFRNQGDVFFKKEWLRLVNEEVKPRAISLAGGGEPTLYPNFDETIRYLKTGVSSPDIGLITNGVFIPKGNWIKELSWLRVSLYSIINGSYAGRESKLQEKVLDNILKYMEMQDLDMLGVSLLYYEENIIDCIELTYKLFKLLTKTKRPVDNFNLQFKRAFVMSDPRNLTSEIHEENLRLLPTVSSIKFAIGRIKELVSYDYEFGEFLETCSNYKQFEKLLIGGRDFAIDQTNPKIHRPNNFSNCYTVLENRLITPDGYIYACPTIAENRDISFSLGHITDNEEYIYNQICKYYYCNSKWCNKRFCRHATHNELVRSYIETKNVPEFDEEILKDNFF